MFPKQMADATLENLAPSRSSEEAQDSRRRRSPGRQPLASDAGARVKAGGEERETISEKSVRAVTKKDFPLSPLPPPLSHTIAEGCRYTVEGLDLYSPTRQGMLLMFINHLFEN